MLYPEGSNSTATIKSSAMTMLPIEVEEASLLQQFLLSTTVTVEPFKVNYKGPPHIYSRVFKIFRVKQLFERLQAAGYAKKVFFVYVYDKI